MKAIKVDIINMTNNSIPEPPIVGTKNHHAGFPAYHSRTVDEIDAQKLDKLKQAENSEVFITRKAGVGLWYVIAAFFLPAVLFYANEIFTFLGFSSEWKMEHSSTVMGVYIWLCILVWAGGIVKCVWEMIKYHAALSGIGLFLGLIAPFAWGTIAVLAAMAAAANTLNNIGTGLTG